MSKPFKVVNGNLELQVYPQTLLVLFVIFLVYRIVQHLFRLSPLRNLLRLEDKVVIHDSTCDSDEVQFEKIPAV